MTVVLEFSRRKLGQEHFAWYSTNVPNLHLPPNRYDSYESALGPNFSERDAITILAIREGIESGQVSLNDTLAFLLHSAALHFLHLEDRRIPKLDDNLNAERVLISFTQAATSFLWDQGFLDQLDSWNVACNVADLVDGALLSMIMHSGEFCSQLLSNQNLKTKFEHLCLALANLSGKEIVPKAATEWPMSAKVCNSSSSAPMDGAVLSFNNPVFDKHLAPIHLRVNENPVLVSAPVKSRVFKELTHWHNHKKAIMGRGHLIQQGFKERRRNQWFMAEMQSYAASLTNAAGNLSWRFL